MKRKIYIRPAKQAKVEVRQKQTRQRNGKVTVYIGQDFYYADTWLYPRADVVPLTQEALKELLQ